MEIYNVEDTGLPGNNKPISLLYVDDEPALLELCRIYLEKTGEFRIDTSESAREALTRLLAGQYDIIISDYQMPQMDGLELLREVRKTYPDLPFIIFTGRSREEVAISALNAGATFYLQKGGDVASQFAELANEIRLAVNKQRSEKELIESERRYRNLVDTQSDFIVRSAPDGRIIFANNAYCRYFSLDKSACVGSAFRPVIPAKEQRNIKELFTGLTPERPSGTIVHRILLPEGEIRWHQWTTIAIFDPLGRLTEYQSVGRDITDVKHAENLWHTAIDSSSSATAIVEYSGVISYGNQTFADLAGFPLLQEIVGMNVVEFIFPDDRPRMEKYHNLRHTGSACAPSRYSFRFCRKDGTIHTAMVTAAAVPDTRKTILSIADMPGLHELELKQKQMESLYRLIIDHMHDGYYRIDSSGIVVQIGPGLAARLGFEQTEIIGKSISSLPIDVDNRDEFLSRLREEGIVSGHPGFMQKDDGTRVKISITGHALSPGDSDTGGIEGIVIETAGTRCT